MLQWPRPHLLVAGWGLLYGAVLLVVLRFWMGKWTGAAVCKFQREHVIELFPHDAGKPTGQSGELRHCRLSSADAGRQQARMGTELLHRVWHPDDYNEKHDAANLMDAQLIAHEHSLTSDYLASEHIVPCRCRTRTAYINFIASVSLYEYCATLNMPELQSNCNKKNSAS